MSNGSLATDGFRDVAHEPLARVVVALPHVNLRNAISAALGASDGVSVVGRTGDLEDMIRIARESRPDGVVLGSGLLRGDIAGQLRRLIAAVPGVRFIVVGTETSAAYASVVKSAGAADYVAFDAGTDGVVSAVMRSIPNAEAAGR